MMADAVDLVKLDTGRDESGLLFGFLGTTNKLAYGIAVGVMYPLLQYLGFNAADDAQNSPDVLSSVTLLYVFPTAILVFAGLAALINYPLSATEHIRVREQLSQNKKVD